MLMRQGVRRLLGADPGIEVVDIARDGLEALAKVEKLKPDVMTMDVEMPHLDGLRATRRLRGAGFAGPIVVVSGSDREDVEQAAARAGATSFVRKSRAYETLISAIRTALEHAGDPDDVVFAA